MSKTIRKRIIYDKIHNWKKIEKEGGDAETTKGLVKKTSKRLTPYTKKGQTKKYGRENKGYYPFQGFDGNTNRSKEIKTNANRSMKKTVRQENKKNTQQEFIDVLYDKAKEKYGSVLKELSK